MPRRIAGGLTLAYSGDGVQVVIDGPRPRQCFEIQRLVDLLNRQIVGQVSPGGRVVGRGGHGGAAFRLEPRLSCANLAQRRISTGQTVPPAGFEPAVLMA
jgi:hypothetical protein